MKKHFVAGIFLLAVGATMASIGPKKSSEDLIKTLIILGDLKLINADSVQLENLPLGLYKSTKEDREIYYLKIISNDNLCKVYIWNTTSSIKQFLYLKSKTINSFKQT